MVAVKDITGQRFSRLTVLERHFSSPKGLAVWSCLCECGAMTRVTGSNLRSGAVKSCGCLMIERATHAATTHGLYRSPAHVSWMNMMQRCFNPKNHKWPRYGKRGITVCARWLKFENFYADMGERPSGKSIDRINNDGDYEPGNCRWATPKEQRANQSKPSVDVQRTQSCIG